MAYFQLRICKISDKKAAYNDVRLYLQFEMFHYKKKSIYKMV